MFYTDSVQCEKEYKTINQKVNSNYLWIMVIELILLFLYLFPDLYPTNTHVFYNNE